jgi:WD40 repeat protein
LEQGELFCFDDVSFNGWINLFIYQHYAKIFGTMGGLGIDVGTLFSNCHRVIQKYRAVLETHALQVYYSPLISMPKCYLLDLTQKHGPADVPHLKSERATWWTNNTMVLEGHTGYVLSVAFSLDGTRVASGSSDNTIRLWDSKTGREATHMSGHTDWIRSVVFSPDGMHIASGSDDKTVRLWDTQTGYQVIQMDRHTDVINSVAFSPYGMHIASGSDDKTIRLWDTQTGHQVIQMDGHTDWI